ncbi:hypothetical protein HID58_073807 [Brassica napus]|uniref:Nucleolar protein 10 n=1 Tax=Brassica napus TaxID=3708 RepID=A0ABQ7YF44_BRANA|nr:hypothetical protein HID58_073807 [Brassica napus]
MYLQCYINEKGDKVYTTKHLVFLCSLLFTLQTLLLLDYLKHESNSIMQKESPLGLATESAHPARFSPDDKYSKERVTLKKRFGLLPIQGAPVKY